MKAAKFGKTRSEQEQNLRSEGYNSLSDEQLDKSDYIERKLRDITGSQHNSLSQADLDSFDDTLPGSLRTRASGGWNSKSPAYMQNFDGINWESKQNASAK